jgi:hypothetical protein
MIVRLREYQLTGSGTGLAASERASLATGKGKVRITPLHLTSHGPPLAEYPRPSHWPGAAGQGGPLAGSWGRACWPSGNTGPRSPAAGWPAGGCSSFKLRPRRPPGPGARRDSDPTPTRTRSRNERAPAAHWPGWGAGRGITPRHSGSRSRPGWHHDSESKSHGPRLRLSVMGLPVEYVRFT